MSSPLGNLDFATFAENLSKLVPHLIKVVSAGTYLCGVFFCIQSIFLFRIYGEVRMMMPSNADLRKPLSSLLVGVLLLYWPELLKAIMLTVFNRESPSPMSYSSGEFKKFKDLIEALGSIFQLVGFFAFIRGWVLFTRIGSSNVQPGGFAKALVHVLAGLLAINIFQIVDLLASFAKS